MTSYFNDYTFQRPFKKEDYSAVCVCACVEHCVYVCAGMPACGAISVTLQGPHEDCTIQQRTARMN
jgi:hypothetical protein